MPRLNRLWLKEYANMISYSLVFGVFYWYIWTRLLPRYRGYRLEEETRVLDDGTTVTKLVHKAQ